MLAIIENYFTNETSFLKETCMSLTGETKNTIDLSNDLFVKVWPSFKMSYLYMPKSYRGFGYDLKIPLSQHLQWFWSYEKISFRVEGGLHARRAKGPLSS